MQLTPTRWRPTLRAALCRIVALPCAGMLWAGMLWAGMLGASYAVDLDDRGLNSQRQFSPPQLQRYVSELVRRYDTNADGLLQPGEWRLMRGQPQRIDHDGDQLLTYEELLLHVSQFALEKRLAPQRDPWTTPPPAPRAPQSENLASSAQATQPAAKPFFVPDRFLPQGLPEWFRARDANGDAQLSLAEFAPTGEAQLAAQFQRSDANGDGLITPAEAVRSAGRTEPVAATEPAPREKNRAKVPSDASGAP